MITTPFRKVKGKSSSSSSSSKVLKKGKLHLKFRMQSKAQGVRDLHQEHGEASISNTFTCRVVALQEHLRQCEAEAGQAGCCHDYDEPRGIECCFPHD